MAVLTNLWKNHSATAIKPPRSRAPKNVMLNAGLNSCPIKRITAEERPSMMADAVDPNEGRNIRSPIGYSNTVIQKAIRILLKGAAMPKKGHKRKTTITVMANLIPSATKCFNSLILSFPTCILPICKMNYRLSEGKAGQKWNRLKYSFSKEEATYFEKW